MSSKIVHTEVDGRRLKLSNLDKVLYPSVGITKAEVIQYYLGNAKMILPYLAERALTVIRFPDGVGGKSFYSKDKPDWTPEWLPSILIEHDEKTIDYLYVKSQPELTWLANLAALELHPMQFRVHDRDRHPDLFIFDLDPDESITFDQVKEAAWRLKAFLESLDYTPFIKTSGGKGLHLVVPILPNWDFETLIDSVKKMTKAFIAQYPRLYTLQVHKEKRKGKILIDIYRNHLSNTTVAPYSLRGRKGAPISWPIAWEQLDDIHSGGDIHMGNYKNYLKDSGEPWADWRQHASELHDQRIQVAMAAGAIDDRLLSYVDKRELATTPEPYPDVTARYTDQYVVQLHDASNLHYDLRLEDNGVLWSWAIPKGLPFRKGQKRLAIRTEDHPVKYLHFEGLIPKGAYGAGEMWVVHGGHTIWHKKEERSLSFTIDQRRYKLYQTKNKDQWLIETDSDHTYINQDRGVSPMLAEASDVILAGAEWGYEVKWDGIRVLIYVEDDEIRIISRNGNDLTGKFPELQDMDRFDLEQGVFDGEIVVLDDQGRPIFHDVISRMHTGSAVAIERLARDKPVVCYLFDMLTMDGRDIIDEPLHRRRAWLKTVVRYNNTYRFSETFADGQSLYGAIEAKGMEGIMLKDQNSRYAHDSRSRSWLKVKVRNLDQSLIIGYTEGKGDRAGLFGALHLAKETDEGLIYMGKVGTGYDHKKLKELNKIVSSIPEITKPIDDQISEESRTHWIQPKLKCEIQYASMSANDTYREPVFIRLINEES